MTSHANLCLNHIPGTTLQNNENLKPKNWLFEDGDSGINEQSLDRHDDYFQKAKKRFIASRLRVVASQQTLQNGTYADYVDKAITNKKCDYTEKNLFFDG